MSWRSSPQRAAAQAQRSHEAERERLALIARVSEHIEAIGRGPAEVRKRVTDHRDLVVDARGWVHAVIGRSFEHGMWTPYEARDLRGYRWAPSRPPR